MLGVAADYDEFGVALATGDFDGNGSDDLAIGVPGENSGSISDAGAVQVLYGLDGTTGAFGTVRFNAATLAVSEGDGLTGVAVTRGQSAVPALTVSHGRSGGTATPGSDFTYASGSLTWDAGDTAIETFSFTVLEDTLDEPDETIVLSLSSPSAGSVVGAPGTLTITLVDNDVGGSLQFSQPTFSAIEGAGSMLVVVARTGGAASNVTVHYETWAAGGGTATPGQDYTPVSGTLTFAAGDGGKLFAVPILNDLTDEPDETIAVRLTAPGGGARWARRRRRWCSSETTIRPARSSATASSPGRRPPGPRSARDPLAR
jgi:hypothetical protein